MVIEKLIFNFLALFLFIFILAKMFRRDDTSYTVVLAVQAVGIFMNFLEIIFHIFTGIPSKVIMYFLAIAVPVLVSYFESKNLYFLEIRNVSLAKIYQLIGKEKQAKKMLIDLVTKYPYNYKGHKMLGEIYEKEGGMRKAIDEYVKVIDIRKKDFDTYYKIAFLLCELGQNKESETMLQNLLKIKPDYYDASNLLGEVYCKQEKFKEAINVYLDALKYRPVDYELYYNLGIVYTMNNDFQNAKACYEKAADINHLLYNAHYSLGQIALLSHDIDLAEDYFTKSLCGEEIEAKAYYQLAKIYMGRNEKEKATIFLNKAIEKEPEYAQKIEEEPIFLSVRKYIEVPKRSNSS